MASKALHCVIPPWVLCSDQTKLNHIPCKDSIFCFYLVQTSVWEHSLSVASTIYNFRVVCECVVCMYMLYVYGYVACMNMLYVYVCKNACMCVYEPVNSCLCVWACMTVCTSICIYMYECVCECVHVCMGVYVFVCVQAHTYHPNPSFALFLEMSLLSPPSHTSSSLPFRML